MFVGSVSSDAAFFFLARFGLHDVFSLGGASCSGLKICPCSGGSISDSTESEVAFAANLMRVVAFTGNWLSSMRHVNVIVRDDVVDSLSTRMIRVSWASHRASAFARNLFLASMSSAGFAMFPFVGSPFIRIWQSGLRDSWLVGL